jgi:hypothetical protein
MKEYKQYIFAKGELEVYEDFLNRYISQGWEIEQKVKVCINNDKVYYYQVLAKLELD